VTEPDPVVLLIEDEPQMRRFLRAAFGTQRLRLVEADTAREGLALAASHNPDVILLDLGLPDADGIDVTRQLREWTGVPIIVLSARGQEHDKIAALDAGADDYLTKPFAVGELLARIRVALRHAARSAIDEPLQAFTSGRVRVDLVRRQVFVDDAEVHLTPTEYKLLTALVRYAGRVVTHRQLLKEVWGVGAIQQTHLLRVYMTQLRHKLEKDPARPRLLTTEPGVGYRLRDE
jgi:two-component system, OmpR family, KDP operon response regulator KdpE